MILSTFHPFPIVPPLFLQGVSMIFWYLKIQSKPNGILGILSGRNDDAETLSFLNKFQ
jgi:hypothetical protein